MMKTALSGVCFRARLTRAVSLFARRFALALVILLFAAPHSFSEQQHRKPSMFQSLVKQGVELMRERKFGEAIEKLEAALLLDPKNVRVMYQLGLCYYTVGIEGDKVEYIEKAQVLWKSAAKSLPKDNLMAITLNDIARRAEESKKDVKETIRLSRAIGKKKNFLDDGIKLAELFRKRRLYEKAKKLYDNLIELYPSSPRPYYGRGEMAYQEGKILYAEKYWKLALSKDPYHEKAGEKIKLLEEELEALRLEGYEGLVKSSH